MTGTTRWAGQAVTSPKAATAAFVVGYRDFTWTGDIRRPGSPALPDRPGILHAALVRAPGPTEAWFQAYSGRRSTWRSACGTELLAIAPVFFDDGVRWACSRCGDIIDRWLDDPRLVPWEYEALAPQPS